MASTTDRVKINQKIEQARELWRKKTQGEFYITIGMGTCGLAAGAAETLKAIEAELKQRNLQAKVSRVGCVGMCSYEPMVELQMPGRPRINYGKVTADRVSEILTAYLDGKPVQGSVVPEQHRQRPQPRRFFEKTNLV